MWNELESKSDCKVGISKVVQDVEFDCNTESRFGLEWKSLESKSESESVSNAIGL